MDGWMKTFRAPTYRGPLLVEFLRVNKRKAKRSMYGTEIIEFMKPHFALAWITYNISKYC